MLFAGLISAYLISWISAGSHYRPEWVHESWPIVMTGINTILLVSSSFTLLWAEKSVLKNKPIWPGLLITTVLGAIFVSIQAREWLELRHENLWWNTGGTYTSNFFTLTGFHGLHVCIGVLLLLSALLGALLGKFTPHPAHAADLRVALLALRGRGVDHRVHHHVHHSLVHVPELRPAP